MEERSSFRTSAFLRRVHFVYANLIFVAFLPGLLRETSQGDRWIYEPYGMGGWHTW
jgi:hypothetical protein